MKKLLPILIIVVAALVGGGGGFFLKMKTTAKPADGEHADASHETDGKGKNDGHGKKSKGGHGEPAEGVSTYMKFKRQFVVPVMKNGRPEMLMIFDINIEVDSSFDDSAYSYEPRLRDAILSQLFVFANDGELARITESAETLARIKASLLETSRKIMGDSAKEILLLDVGIQEY